jgi:translation initiation factor IF-2
MRLRPQKVADLIQRELSDLLRRDVREVKAGFECGMSLKNFQDLKVGDQFEAFEVLEVARTL